MVTTILGTQHIIPSCGMAHTSGAAFSEHRMLHEYPQDALHAFHVCKNFTLLSLLKQEVGSEGFNGLVYHWHIFMYGRHDFNSSGSETVFLLATYCQLGMRSKGGSPC